MKGKGGAVLVISLYALFGIGYSLLMPVWEAPDERAHYGYAFNIARTGELPSHDENYESFQPSLYYRIAALPIRLVRAIEPALALPFLPPILPVDEDVPRYDWNAGNYTFLLAPLLLRWMGVGFGVLALWSIYAAVRRVFPAEPDLALGTIALIGGIPQFIHITASVNNDVLAILAGAVLFFFLAEVCRWEVLGRRALGVLAAALLLPAVVKLTVLPLGLTAAAAVIYRGRRLQRAQIARYAAAAVFLALPALVLLSSFYPETLDRFVDELRYRLLTIRPGIGEESVVRVVARYLWNFWGKVGWVSVGIPIPAFAALTVLAAAGFGSGLWGLLQSRNGMDLPPMDLSPGGKRLLVFSLIAVGAAGLIIARNFLTSPQLQGRFFFPTLGPIALLVVFGWRRILGDRARFLAPITVMIFVLLNLHLWITGVIPVYFQPFLDR